MKESYGTIKSILEKFNITDIKGIFVDLKVIALILGL